MKHGISKNTEIATSNGTSDFEIMGTPPINVNIPKKVTSPVTNEIQKLTLTKPVTLKIVLKKIALSYETRVTCHGEFPLIGLQDPSISWFCGVV